MLEATLILYACDVTHFQQTTTPANKGHTQHQHQHQRAQTPAMPELRGAVTSKEAGGSQR